MKGFSLVELMISITVISILTALSIPSYNTYVNKKMDISALVTIRNTRTKLIHNFVTAQHIFPTRLDQYFSANSKISAAYYSDNTHFILFVKHIKSKHLYMVKSDDIDIYMLTDKGYKGKTATACSPIHSLKSLMSNSVCSKHNKYNCIKCLECVWNGLISQCSSLINIPKGFIRMGF